MPRPVDLLMKGQTLDCLLSVLRHSIPEAMNAIKNISKYYFRIYKAKIFDKCNYMLYYIILYYTYVSMY